MEISIKELAKLIRPPDRLSRASSSGIPASPTGSRAAPWMYRRAEKFFGFRAQVPFEEGLRRTIEWYQAEIRIGSLSCILSMSETDDHRPRPSEEVLILRPSRGWAALNLGDLWRYRELIYFLIWRDVKVRYKQTVLGAAWAILQPFITMVVFTMLFGRLAKMPSDGIPYPIFCLHRPAALGLVHQGARGRRALAGRQPQHDHQGLFPAPGHPDLASVLAGLVDFAIWLSWS